MEACGWLLAKGCAPVLQSHTQALLRESGIELTAEEVQRIFDQRDVSLREAGRVEFGSGSVELVINAFARSSALAAHDAASSLCAAVELFYTLRSSLAIEVGDAEIVDVLLEAFEECQGACELIDVDVVLKKFELRGEGYSITDSAGKTYHWDPTEWEYSDQADGWDGELWAGDFDA